MGRDSMKGGRPKKQQQQKRKLEAERENGREKDCTWVNRGFLHCIFVWQKKNKRHLRKERTLSPISSSYLPKANKQKGNETTKKGKQKLGVLKKKG